MSNLSKEKWWRKVPEYSRAIDSLVTEKYDNLAVSMGNKPNLVFPLKDVDNLVKIILHTGMNTHPSYNAACALSNMSRLREKNEQEGIFSEASFKRLFLLCNICVKKDFDHIRALQYAASCFPSLSLEYVNDYVTDDQVSIERKIIGVNILEYCKFDEGLRKILSIFANKWLSSNTVASTREFCRGICLLMKKFSLKDYRLLEALQSAFIRTKEDEQSNKYRTNENYYDSICFQFGIELETHHPLLRLCPHCDFKEGFLKCLKHQRSQKKALAEKVKKVFMDVSLCPEERLYAFDHYISLGGWVHNGRQMITKRNNVSGSFYFQRDGGLQSRNSLILSIPSVCAGKEIQLLTLETRSGGSRGSLKRNLTKWDGNEMRFSASSDFSKSFVCFVPLYSSEFIAKERSFRGSTSEFLSIAFSKPCICVTKKKVVFSLNKKACRIEEFDNIDPKVELSSTYFFGDGKTFPMYSIQFDVLTSRFGYPPTREVIEKHLLFNHTFLSLIQHKGKEWLVYAEDLKNEIHFVDLHNTKFPLVRKIPVTEEPHVIQERLISERIFSGHDWEVFGVQISEKNDIIVSCDGNEIILWDFETAALLHRIYNVPLCLRLLVQGGKIFFGYRATAIKFLTIPANIRELSTKEKGKHFYRSSGLYYEHVKLKDYKFYFYDIFISQKHVFIFGSETNSKDPDNVRVIKCVKVFEKESMNLIDVIYTTKYEFVRGGDNEGERVYHNIVAWKNFIVVAACNTIKLYDLYSPKKNKMIKRWDKSCDSSSTNEFAFRYLKIIEMEGKKKGFHIYAAAGMKLYKLDFTFQRLCKKCKRIAKKMKCCGGCKNVTFYCSRKCQTDDWKRHKMFCRSSRKI